MRFCEHEWKYKEGQYPGLVIYNKVMVYGCHDLFVCNQCGKHRWKLVRFTEFKVYGQKELNDYYKKIGYVKSPVQLEFI